MASGLSRRWKRGPGLAVAFGPRQNAAGGAPQGERAAITRAPHPSRCGHRLVRLAALHLPSTARGFQRSPGADAPRDRERLPFPIIDLIGGHHEQARHAPSPNRTTTRRFRQRGAGPASALPRAAVLAGLRQGALPARPRLQGRCAGVLPAILVAVTRGGPGLGSRRHRRKRRRNEKQGCGFGGRRRSRALAGSPAALCAETRT